MQKRTIKMMMSLKFNDAAADRDFNETKIARKLLIPEAESNISLTRMRGSLPSINSNKRLEERERRSEGLAEMSLGALLYYVLVEEGTIADEPA
jgi:hypothetical protein